MRECFCSCCIYLMLSIFQKVYDTGVKLTQTLIGNCADKLNFLLGQLDLAKLVPNTTTPKEIILATENTMYMYFLITTQQICLLEKTAAAWNLILSHFHTLFWNIICVYTNNFNISPYAQIVISIYTVSTFYRIIYRLLYWFVIHFRFCTMYSNKKCIQWHMLKTTLWRNRYFNSKQYM